MDSHRTLARKRIAAEIGTITKDAPECVALVYPSPYHAGMSSLGFQTMYREINTSTGRAAHRAFLPDDVEQWKTSRTPLFTYEFERPVSHYPVIGLSVAYEMELAGVIHVLELSGLPALAQYRDERHPLVIAGGPLTFSNPLPLAPFVDVILMGEADVTIHQALDIAFDARTRAEALAIFAKEIPSAFVPLIHGNAMPGISKCPDDRLPAYAAIRTAETELSNMFLVEAERGCSRQCGYCVMRRSTNGGMRLVDKERILELIPEDTKRVGLVGAAVSDHPQIVDVLETLAKQGREAGLSSLRPDRLNDRFVGALKAVGYRTLTTAADGPSQRMRNHIQRKTLESHLLKAAQLTRDHGLDRMKLYMMVGLPDERDDDIDELIRFSIELSRLIPLAMGIAPFVSKRNTPLDGMPFAGIDVVERRLERLRRGVHGRVDIRSTSARWAWVEHVLAQGGRAEGKAVMQAVRNGGKYRHWQDAFDQISPNEPRRQLAIVV